MVTVHNNNNNKFNASIICDYSAHAGKYSGNRVVPRLIEADREMSLNLISCIIKVFIIHKLSLKLVSDCRFPNTPERFVNWKRAMRRKDFQPTKHDVLCSDHFAAEDFVRGARANLIPT